MIPEQKQVKGEVYLTEETRIGTYLGKTLYRKIITGVVPSATEEAYVDAEYDIAENINPYEIFVENAWMTEMENGFPNLCNLPYVLHTSSLNVDVKYFTKNGKFVIRSRISYFNNMPFTAIIKYTKTTD